MVVSVENRSPSGDHDIGPLDVDHRTHLDFEIENIVVDTATTYDAHYHGTDQLAWMGAGAMMLEVRNSTWHLRRDHFAWIPAGTLHRMAITEPGELINVYTDVALRPTGERWSSPCTVVADQLATALFWHLLDRPRSVGRTALVQQLLGDVLAEADIHLDAVSVPTDARARTVATALLADPADERELAHWARAISVSEKTLSRAFVAETGSTFRQWRQRVRLHHAAGMLAAGQPVATAAENVGYRSTSSFIVAFTERYSITPGRYLRASAR